MKKHIILILISIVSYSCANISREQKVEENCFFVLDAVSQVAVVYDKRNEHLLQMIDELKNHREVNIDNLNAINRLSIESDKRIKKSVADLQKRQSEFQKEEIFETSINYLLKANEIEQKIP